MGPRLLKTKPPNVLFILADDLGYADLGCYGSRHTSTPALDRLAAEGLRLTQAYANSPVCSATRTAIITGQYQYRFPVGLAEPVRSHDRDLGLPPSTKTLPGMLKTFGYATSLVGKWHLGTPPRYGPLTAGYDRFFGFHFGGVDYFTHSHRPPGKVTAAWDGLYEGLDPVSRDGYLTDLLADEAVSELARLAAGPPFLLSLHFNAPHWPWEGPNDRARASELNSLRDGAGGSLETYAAMVAALDAGIGRVLEALAALGIERDTLVIFTSDNGGERYSDVWPLVGLKGELLEGGIRVPAILRWPVGIPSGVSRQVAASMDWAPTILAAAGATSVGSFDGIDILPSLRSGLEAPRRIFWRYGAHQQTAIRDHDWKYLSINGAEYLFDLGPDGRERANLSTTFPKILDQLREAFSSWDQGMLPYPTTQFSESAKGRYVDRY